MCCPGLVCGARAKLGMQAKYLLLLDRLQLCRILSEPKELRCKKAPKSSYLGIGWWNPTTLANLRLISYHLSKYVSLLWDLDAVVFALRDYLSIVGIFNRDFRDGVIALWWRCKSFHSRATFCFMDAQLPGSCLLNIMYSEYHVSSCAQVFLALSVQPGFMIIKDGSSFMDVRNREHTWEVIEDYSMPGRSPRWWKHGLNWRVSVNMKSDFFLS